MVGRCGSPRFAVGLAAALSLAVVGDTPAQDPGQPPPFPGGPPTPAPGSQPPGGPGDVLPPPVNTSGPVTASPVVLSGPGMPPVQRFNFKIDPKTPAKDLLPTPPAAKASAGPVLTDELTKVPEVEFQARPEKADPAKSTEHAAHQLAKINHMNAKKTDAFMSALLDSREDLAGLPFAMGDACRTVGERAKQFTIAANTVRQALGGSQVFALTSSAPPQAFSPPNGPPQQLQSPQNFALTVTPFWKQYTTLCEQQDAVRTRPDKALAEHVTLARIGALTQMLAAEPAELRLGLVKYLTAVPHPEATRVLARMAIFSAEDDVRAAALESLKVRRERDYTDVLVKGLRYPWPAVAKRSADAAAKLGRTDLVPELVSVLAETDPRLPAEKEVGGKKVSVVREMVKINHHRNCVMCHAPTGSGAPSENALTAEVAVPGQPLPLPSEGYRQSSPDLMIRIDVTYLRQDFSASLPVPDAHPWPENQRFDFFVRDRTVTPEEAEAYRTKLTPKETGVLSPYHKAAVAALRELTGKDTAPTAEAWRKLLNISAKAD